MSPETIVHTMLQNDCFSQWLGIEILESRPGFCQLKINLRKDMCNGFGVAHGGITFSLADSALAFAANAQGKKALSIETSISHLKSVLPGEVLIATANEQHRSLHLGRYEVRIEKEDQTAIALFRGTVYYKEDWNEDDL